MDKHRLRWLPKHQIQKAQGWLERWGGWVVAANRFLSGARSIISLSVGMARLDPTKTALFATLSAFLWTALISYAGMKLGENWPLIGDYLKAYGTVILVTVGGILGLVLLRYYVRWRAAVRKRNGTSPDEVDQNPS